MHSVLISSSQAQGIVAHNLWENQPDYPQAVSKPITMGTTWAFMRSLCQFVAQVYTTAFYTNYRAGVEVLHTIHTPNNKYYKGD